MAGAAQENADDEISGINVTPFVDIALVLLIIFMVTAKYIVSQSIPVDLPEASTGQSNAAAATVSVSVDSHGDTFVDSERVDDRTLLARVRARFDANHEVRAVIAADRVVPHGRVTRVIDVIRQAGISRFAIQTDPSTPVEP